MGIVEEYLKYQEEYQEKYGERTVILMEVGSFMEIYEYDPTKVETDEEKVSWPTQKLGYATYLSSLLGYVLTKRNKAKPYSLTNPHMIGFPCVAYEKHKDILLSKDFTIVVVEQFSPSGSKIINRKVSKVLSPATEMNSIHSGVSNQIVSIYIEIQKEAPKYEDYLITVGVSTIDVTTGVNIVGEIYSKEKDAIYALQEVYRFLLSTQPREIIVNIHNIKKDPEKYKTYIISTLEINNCPISSVIVNEINKEYLKGHYHQQFLTKVFNTKISGKLKLEIQQKNVIEDLGLERLYYGTISYVLLLQYCYEHNERLIEKLKNPDTHWIDEEKHLVIAHNALKQLDIPLQSKNTQCLFSIINHTSTSLGKRFLHSMLCNPITSVETLNEYYTMISDLINDQGLLKDLMEQLKKIPDMERYQRKLQLRLIKPNEFVILFRGYVQLVKIYTSILGGNTTLKKLLFKEVNEFNNCLTLVLSKYDLDQLMNAKLSDQEIEGAIFYPGSDSTSDQYIREIKHHEEKIESIMEHLNSHLGSTRGKLIELPPCSANNKKDLAFFTTLHKGSVLSNSSIDQKLCGQVQVTTVNKEAMITSTVIAEILQNLYNKKSEYNQYLYRCYTRTINDISNYEFFTSINTFVSKLDYVCSNTKTALKYNYFRPEISDSNTDVSFAEMKELRHPIAERIIESPYVTNDISLGTKPYGMLLYGSNSVGKSTLAKAIGLNLIMAQCGMYVPCKMKYVPYHKIITRLSGEDNLLQGQSSFVVEMSELRTILRNADSKTLVLGDELCRGTESVSGTSLTIATITELVDRKVSFLFSSHLHNLIESSYIINLPKNTLRVCHLVLRYDETTKSLIYDRKLKEGHGESIYGLEVAMSLSIDPAFIRKASEIRHSITSQNTELLCSKTSRYNKKVYMDACSICGKQAIELQTHHIAEQAKADANGFITLSESSFHKDSTFNLIVLCEKCHKNVHKQLHTTEKEKVTAKEKIQEKLTDLITVN